MKNLFTISLALLLGGGAIAQVDANEKDLRAKAKGNTDSTKTWSKGGIFNLGFGQTALHNWAAGGLNSYSFNGLLSLYANHSKGKLAWDNSLDLEYGAIKQFGQGDSKNVDWFKNSDRIELNSKVGYEAGGNWYYAALLNFRSQMAPGYNADGSTVISDIFSPAYTTLSLGMDYRPNDNFSVFIGPLSYRMLYVAKDSLRNSFGIDDIYDANNNFERFGDPRLDEIGAYLKMNYKKDEPFGIKNVNFQTDLALFSNYLDKPQNIDVYWNTIIGMKVNKYITATIGTNLIYDDDIEITTTEVATKDANGNPLTYKKGPRTQFKEALTIGFSYKF